MYRLAEGGICGWIGVDKCILLLCYGNLRYGELRACPAPSVWPGGAACVLLVL